MVLAAFSLLISHTRCVHGFLSISIGSQRKIHAGFLRPMPAMSTSTLDETKLVQNMLERIRTINQMPDHVRDSVIDFKVDGIKLGKVSVPFVFTGQFNPKC